MADCRIDGAPNAADGRQSLDEQVEEMLHDIEDASPFVVRAAQPPEDLDPSDPLELHVDSGAVADVHPAAVETHIVEQDEQLVEQVEQTIAEQEQRQLAEEEAQVRRARLRRALALVTALLVTLAVVVGVLIGVNTCRPQVQGAGTDTLADGSAETPPVEFRPIDANLVPNVASWFGLTLDEARERSGGALEFEDGLERASDVGTDGFEYVGEANVPGASGEQEMTFTFGLDSRKRIVYAYCLFDLDALGVADARLEELAADDTVARSLLAGLGVDVSAISPQELTLQDGAAPTVLDAVESCEFEGRTGKAGAPSTWTLSESYDHTVGKLAGDNSVMRTIIVELL